jgi:hypothetical protein
MASLILSKTPQKHQIELRSAMAIHGVIIPQNHCLRDYVFVGVRTGSGKALVVNCAAAILTGITVRVVRTTSLGVDQTDNYNQNVSGERDQARNLHKINSFGNRRNHN